MGERLCWWDGMGWDEQTENCLQFAIFEVSGEMQGPGLDRPSQCCLGTRMLSGLGW